LESFEARQILRFLKMHVHPSLSSGDQPLIPGNVEDQIFYGIGNSQGSGWRRYCIFAAMPE
jgi:hypothetical protein